MDHMRLDDVAAFLTSHFAEPVEALAEVGIGEWSRAFTFRRGQADFVVRFSATDEDFLKDQRAFGFASETLPVPRVVELGVTFDGFYAISERAFGTYFEEADADAMRRLLPGLFAALDAMRAADVSETTGFGEWRGDGSAPHPTWRSALLAVADDPPTGRTHGWRARLESSPIGSQAFDQAYARLEGLIDACPEQRYLVHSDLLHYNVLVDSQRITAVLDWGCSLYGDFVFDLAWIAFWQPWYTAWARIDIIAEARRHYSDIGLDVPDLAERLRCCELVIGLGGMAYQAFTQRWDELAWTARRTLEVALPS